MGGKSKLVVPELGESITEAVVGKWLKTIGEFVEADEAVVDLETDKITMQVTSPVAGALTEQLFDEGATVKVGEVVGNVDTDAKGAPAPPAKTQAPAGPPAASSTPVPSPKVEAPSLSADDARKMSPSQRRAFRNGEAAAPSQASRSSTPVAIETGPREHVEKMSPLRKRIAERLVLAQHSTASLTTFNEVDMSAVMKLRGQYKENFLEQHGVKLGFMSFFVKAAVEALKHLPGLNAEIRDESIIYKTRYDLGIAVGTEKGLIVPVLRDCDKLGFAEVEAGIIDLATRARQGKLSLDDLSGGTFTITNGGIYGSMMSTPLLNFPQTGILGMHNIVKRAVVMPDGTIEARPMMYIALTYDHRVVDGKEAVQFLVRLKERIENPNRMLLGV